MVRMYHENEVHQCQSCGLVLRVTFTAVPVEPLICCNKEMILLGMDGEVDVPKISTPAQGEFEYQKDMKYTCSICGIEIIILNTAKPVAELDCCGQGMEILEAGN